MSRRQFCVVGLCLALFALLYSPPYLGIMAQELPPESASSAVPTEPEQPDMAYQPPADADEMSDFLPPEGEIIEAPPAQPMTPTVPLSPTMPITLMVPLSLTTPITAVTAVTVTEPLTKLVSFEEGAIAVVFEEDTLTDTAEIELTILPLPQNPLSVTNTISNPVENIILQKFQLEVMQEGEIVSEEFSKPVRLVIDLRSLMQQLDASYQSWNYYLAYQDENNPDIWIEVPLDVYQSDGLLSAEVMHFSNWAAGVRPERWNPSWTPPTVSAFSGAATYSYPLELPPGRHGLQPNVTLSYSSRGLDGRIRDGESGPIGDGWSLGDISVVRVGVKMQNPWGTPWSLHPDKFRLVFNGTGHELFPAAGVNTTTEPTVRYYVKDAPGYYLERNYEANATIVPNQDGIYWILITPDGTRYRLGFTADAEEWQYTSHHSHLNVQGHIGRTHDNGAVQYSAIAWHVDTVTDAFGNQMTYHYHTLNTDENIQWWNTDHWTSFTLTTRKNRISDIKYNYPTRVTSLPASDTVARLTSTPATRIEFRPANTTNPDFQFLINSIFIYHGSGANPVSEYRINSTGVYVNSAGCLNYNYPPYIGWPSRTHIVKSIQRWVNVDGNATTNDPTGYALPATTFYYGDNLNNPDEYDPLSHFTWSSLPCFSFLYMQGYKNGYGGSVRFSYSSDGRSVGEYYYINYDQYTFPTMGYSYRVTEMRANDGRNADLRTTYDYITPCYNQWGAVPSGAVNCAEPNTPEQHGSLVGYQTTTQTNYNYNGTTVLNKQITTFSQNAANSLGRPLDIQVKDINNTLLTQTVHSYFPVAINGLSDMFTYLEWTKNYQYNGGNTLSTKTTYEYNTGYQGNAQYGNLTHIREFDDAADTVPYRTTYRRYYPNVIGDNWLVDKVALEGVYEGNSTLLDDLVAGTWMYYDNQTNTSAGPTQGAVTRIRRFGPDPSFACSNMNPLVSGCSIVFRTAESTFAYDVYGNQEHLYNHANYGYLVFNSGSSLIDDDVSIATGDTLIDYDNTYNLYPVSTTNPLNQTTAFQIYGFNGVAAHQFSNANYTYTTPAGLLKQVTGPDSVTTKYEYDPFGRLLAVYDGDTSYNGTAFYGFLGTTAGDGDPLTRYYYWDNTWNNATTFLNPAGNAPFYISQVQRPGSFATNTSSSGFAFNDQTFFDGFGRPIQTRSIWHWVEGENLSREIYASTAYGANGQVVCQTVPYDLAYYSDAPRNLVWPASPFDSTACISKPNTTTTYDALARPTIVTAADTSQTHYYYGIGDNETPGIIHQRTSIVDANSHAITHGNNSLGQLAYVQEYEGIASPYTPYAQTRYAYDTMGNLTDVWDGLNNNTHMTYDGFGRKLTMNDPDMGYWTYAYDAAGNLIRQKDTKGQAICFGYDALNRLLIKAQDSTPADACPTTLPTSGNYHLASYVYDTAANGIGKPHTVSWGPTPTQNKDTFSYDILGRLTSHNRLVDNRSYTMQTLTFDALHRPLTMKYPDNEVITMTYDREGENSLQAGANPLVSSISYNGMGQMRILNRAGSLADTTYLYHPQNDAGGGGVGDSNFRLKTIQHDTAGSGNAMPDYSYEYDDVGNITKMTSTSTAGTDNQSFGYDHLNRLISAEATGGVANYSHKDFPPLAFNGYHYDKLGNLTSYNGNSYNYTNWNANCTNLPSQPMPHAVKQIGSQYFCYDANGNMTNRSDNTGNFTQRFDVENQLIEVVNTTTGYTTQFRYDAAGQRTMTLSQTGATTGKIIYTPFPNYEEEVPLIFYSGFETGNNWSTTAIFPGSSLYRSTWGTATPAPGSGSYAYALSNHAYGILQSDPIDVSANTQYDLHAWVRGELDADDSNGAWIIRAHFYNSGGTNIGSQDAALGYPGSLTTSWQQKGGLITTPANTATLRISLYNHMNNGWVAFDDVTLDRVTGTPEPVVPNAGFENSANWTEITTSGFPATSFWRNNWGTASPHGGSYSYVISNHVYGAIRSEKVTGIVAGAQYDVYAWVRGELDAEDSEGNWLIQVVYYNSSDTLLSTQNVSYGIAGSLDQSWVKRGGRITTPANTAKIQVLLYNYLNSGWVAYDDVELIKVNTSTNLLANPGFESSGSWTTDSYPDFPATAYWRSTWSTASPHGGTYAYSLSNHSYSYLLSDVILVTPSTNYDLYALVRGEIDGDGSIGYYQLRAYYYDSGGQYISYQTAVSRAEGTLTTAWEEGGGQVTTPANAATLRLYLYNYNSSGWVALDNVRLSKPTGSTIKRSSYGIAGQVIATRVTGDPVSGNNGLSYFYSDHLGSSSALQKPNGSVAYTWYLPFGGYRGTAPTQTITDRDFTGQKENMELGLLYYNARYYVPGLGRFASADTIIPNPIDPQSLNRFSYARNNPLKFTDSSGHSYCDDMPEECQNSAPALVSFDVEAGVEETWHAGEISAVYKGAFDLGGAFARDINARGRAMDLSQFGEDAYQDVTPEEAFLSVMGGTVTFRKTGDTCADRTEGEGCYAAYGGPRLVNVFTDIYDANGNSKIPEPDTSYRWAVHELAHVFEARVNGKVSTYYARNQLPANVLNRNGFAGPFNGWQQSTNFGRGEIFADMVLGWTYDQWSTEAGQIVDAGRKADFMSVNMSIFIDIAR